MEQADIMDPRIGAIYGQLAAGPVADADAYGALLQKIREDELKKQALARGAATVQAVRAGQAPVVVPQAPAPTPVTTTAMPGGTSGPLPQSAIEARQIISGKPQMNQPRQNVMASEMPEVQTEPTVMQERAGAQEESPNVPTPEESVKIATDIIQKSDAPDDQKNDQIEQISSNPDLAQKMAMIAMAVAPTLVGYAAFGKKGAYLGAASTGKGLEAGTKQYIEDEQFKQKMDLEREKKQVSKEKKERDQWVSAGEDKYGNALILNKYTGEIKPAMVSQTGERVTRANVPVARLDTKTGNIVSQMKYERPAEQPAGMMTPVGRKMNDVNRQIKSIKSSNKKFDLYVPTEVEEFAQNYPNHPLGSKTPPAGMSEGVYDEIMPRVNAYFAGAEDAINKAKGAKEPAEKPKAASLQDRAAIDLYKDEIKKWAGNEWKEFRDKHANAEMFLNKPLGQIKERAVADAALWFDYMKLIQQDQSVVREGDVATAMRFMNTKQRIESLVNQYSPLQLGSAMTDGLRKEIIGYLGEMRKIQEKKAMLDINTMIIKGMQQPINISADRTIMPSTARREANAWASSAGISRAPVLGMAAGTPIWKKRIPEMYASGEVKNGQFVKDTDGTPYLIDVTKKPNGKLSVKAIYWAVK